MPLGKSWGIFHPRFSPHHRPTATTAMTAACQLTRQTSAEGTTDPETGEWTPPGRTVLYRGPCRIRPATTIGNEKLQDIGAAMETVRRYDLSLPWHTEPQVGDEIVFLSGVDPALVGRRLRVVTVEVASEQWQRDLTAEEVEAIR